MTISSEGARVSDASWKHTFSNFLGPESSETYLKSWIWGQNQKFRGVLVKKSMLTISYCENGILPRGVRCVLEKLIFLLGPKNGRSFVLRS